jgi:NitT/TauT family transport system ATP-binding protein
MNEPSERMAGGEVDTSLNVVIDQVVKWYPTSSGPLHALDEVSLEMRGGEFVSIVGPSGCGKSTLLLMLAGLIQPTLGTITVGDTVVTKPYTDLGIVFQDSVMLDWYNVLGNVMLQAKMRRLDKAQSTERAMELLSLVGLDGFEKRRPYELSGGMRQRVAICRALLHEPPLLLMDEPFGALDALTRDQLNLDMLDLWARRQQLVMFVTHSILEAVFMSDRVVVMSQRPGKIEAILEIDLPRPRTLSMRETPEFGKYANEIRSIFGRLGILSTESSTQAGSDTDGGLG